jgi:hypothetical protein
MKPLGHPDDQTCPASTSAPGVDLDTPIRASTCLACPPGCPSCTGDESDCECYEHQDQHPDAKAEAVAHLRGGMTLVSREPV